MTEVDIASLLTLRYQPQRATPMRPLKWTNFTPVPWPNPTELVDRAIRTAIRETIDTYKPGRVGIALSGGIDSSTVALLLRDEYPHLPIVSVSVHLREDDPETPHADEVASLIESKHEHRTVTPEELIRDIPRLVKIVDEPRWNLYWYYVVEQLAKRCDLIMTGDGGDEVFGGYNFRYRLFAQAPESLDVQERVQLYLQGHERDWLLSQREVFGPRAKFDWRQIHEVLKPMFDNPLPLLHQCFLADYNGKLLHDYAPTNHAIYDHLHMRASTPLLHPGVTFIGNHLSASEKYRFDYGKPLLRRLLSRYRVGDNIWRKPKIGFGINPAWIVKEEEAFLRERLRTPHVCRDGWINQEWLDAAWERSDDPRVAHKLLSVYALETWIRN